MRPRRRHRKKTPPCLSGSEPAAVCAVALALALASVALVPPSHGEEPKVSGLYRDGKLVDTFDGTGQFEEQIAALRAEFESHPEILTPEAARRNAACARCVRVVEKIAARVADLRERGTGLRPAEKTELEALLGELREARRRLREYFDEERIKLEAAGTDAVILERQEVNAEKFTETMDRLVATAGEAAGGGSRGLNRAAEAFLGVKPRESDAAQADPVRLSPAVAVSPVAAPMLTEEEAAALDARSAGSEAGEDEAPETAGGISPPGAADLAETPEIQFTQEIMEKADELGNDPLTIYEWCRNHFNTQFYGGSRKSGHETLVQRQGSDTDQCSALIAMLRYSGYHSRYVTGTIQLTAEQARAWTGVDDAGVAAGILATTGLDGAGLLGPGSEVVAVRFTHTWVECYMPYSNYRGVPAADTGKTWVSMAPALKRLNTEPFADVDAFAAISFDKDGFLSAYTDTDNVEVSPGDRFEADVQAHFDATDPDRKVDDIRRPCDIEQQNLGYVPASLPGRVVTVQSRSAEVADDQRYKIRLVVTSGAQTYIDHTSRLSDLVSRRVLFRWAGAAPADEAYLDSVGGIYNANPSLYQVKPRLEVDGTVVASSPGAAPGIVPLTVCTLTTHYLAPAGDLNTVPVTTDDIKAPDTLAIVFNTGRDRRDSYLETDTAAALPGNWLPNLYHATCVQHLYDVDRGYLRLQEATKVVTNPDVTATMVTGVTDSETVGMVLALVWKGLCLDNNKRPDNIAAVDGDSSRAEDFAMLSSMERSYNDYRSIERVTGEPAVSTVEIFEKAKAMAIPICTITTSIAADCPGFSHPSSVTDIVNTLLAAGHKVIIPRSQVICEDFEGTGFFDIPPDGRAIQVTITGKLDGTKKREGSAMTTRRLWSGGFNPGCNVTLSKAQVFDLQSPLIFVDDPNPVTFSATVTISCTGESPQARDFFFTTHKTGDQLDPGPYNIHVEGLGVATNTTSFTVAELVPEAGQDAKSFTLQNDRPLKVTFQTNPATPLITLRKPVVKRIISDHVNRTSNYAVETQAAILVTDGNGNSDLVTDASGKITLAFSPGWAGEGTFVVDLPGVKSKDDPVITKADTVKGKSPDIPNGHFSWVEPSSGEFWIYGTDLYIPGRGLDYACTRTHRSQGFHFANVTTHDFAKSWRVRYMDDRLVRDGDSIIHLSSDFRSDTYASHARIPGPQCFSQLTDNAMGDHEIRREDGLVQTFKNLDAPGIPGRLIRTEDRNGNFMTFHWRQIDPDSAVGGDEKFVLAFVIDTMGREIRYLYYADAAQAVGGHPVTVTSPNPAAFGRLALVEDFKGDMDFSDSDLSADFPAQTNNRGVTFGYDDECNLVQATRPAITGTPIGNDFPNGRTYRYAFFKAADVAHLSSQADRDRLLHDCRFAWYPNEVGDTSGLEPPLSQARVKVTYNTDPSSPHFGRVAVYNEGGTNPSGVPAGGSTLFDYAVLDDDSPTPNDPYIQTTVTHPKGNVEVITSSAHETTLQVDQLTEGRRNLEPAAFTWAFTHTQDKLPATTRLPGGGLVNCSYDLASTYRSQQGNRLLTVRLPDARGADQAFLSAKTVHEPVYQRVVAVTGPRGLDPGFVPPLADTGGRTQEERYTRFNFFDYQEGPAPAVRALLADELHMTETEVQTCLDDAGIQLGLGDLNGDGDTTARIGGNVVCVKYPAVSLRAGSNQAAIEGDTLQEIVVKVRHNSFGQPISTVDPEGNIHVVLYYPETDPDGDGVLTPAPGDGRTLSAGPGGGYVSGTITDAAHEPGANNNNGAPPTQIAVSFARDDVGNMIGVTDGRGIGRQFFVNEQGEVVQQVRAASVPGVSAAEPYPLTAFAYVLRVTRDHNGNVIGMAVEDRGDTSNTGGFVDYGFAYDILDQLVRRSEEVDVGKTLVWNLRYDANRNFAFLQKPRGNAIAMLYDERNLLFQTTRGALAATPETLGAPAGPYNPGGGAPSVFTNNYNADGFSVEFVDAEDTDGSAGNNSPVAGVGDVFTVVRDGYNREIGSVDAVGTEVSRTLDPASNVIVEKTFGTTGGPSPTDNLGSSNVLLREVHLNRDEMSRVFQLDQLLFTPAGVVTGGMGAEGGLVPGDGKINAIVEFDAKSQNTFVFEDHGAGWSLFFDGSGRKIEEIDPIGNVRKNAYDGNDNRIETQVTEVSQVAGIAAEIFVSTSFYNAANLPELVVENNGQATRQRFNSRGIRVAVADAQGPPGGSIARRAFAGGALTDNNINGPGNVILQFVDGLGRTVLVKQFLTAGGQGDGVSVGADFFGVPGAPPLVDLTQGGGDGIITTGFELDDNSNLLATTDDQGILTQNTFDNQDRPTSTTHGNVVPGHTVDRVDAPTTAFFQWDFDSNYDQVTDESGNVFVNTRDAANRVVQIDITRAAGFVGTTLQTFEWNGFGLNTRATDNNDPGVPGDDTRTAVAYDSLFRPLGELFQIGANPQVEVARHWTAERLLTGTTYPSGRFIEIDRDLLARVAALRDQGAGTDIADCKYIGPRERVLEWKYPFSGARTTTLNDPGTANLGHDGVRNTNVWRHLRPDNSVIAGHDFDYNRNYQPIVDGKLHLPGNSELYAYDSDYWPIHLKRGTLNGAKDDVTAFTPDANVVQNIEWDLDGSRNWDLTNTTRNLAAVVDDREHTSFNEAYLIDGVTQVHDDNGNLVDDGDFLFTYTAYNHAFTVTRKSDGMPVVSDIYYPGGRRARVVTTNSGALDGTTHTYYLDWMGIADYDAGHVLSQEYLRTGDGWVISYDRNLNGDGTAVGPGDQKIYVHNDPWGSCEALSDATGAANRLEMCTYDPHGKVNFYDGAGTHLPGAAQSAHGNPYWYQQMLLNPVTGQSWDERQCRDLDHDQGRYTTRNAPLPDTCSSGYSRSASNWLYVPPKALNWDPFSGDYPRYESNAWWMRPDAPLPDMCYFDYDSLDSNQLYLSWKKPVGGGFANSYAHRGSGWDSCGANDGSAWRSLDQSCSEVSRSMSALPASARGGGGSVCSRTASYLQWFMQDDARQQGAPKPPVPGAAASSFGRASGGQSNAAAITPIGGADHVPYTRCDAEAFAPYDCSAYFYIGVDPSQGQGFIGSDTSPIYEAIDPEVTGDDDDDKHEPGCTDSGFSQKMRRPGGRTTPPVIPTLPLDN